MHGFDTPGAAGVLNVVANSVRVVTVYRPDPREWAMKCHICGRNPEQTVSSLAFRVSRTAILVIKGLPVLECGNCGEFLLEDKIMARVEELISRVDEAAELEVVTVAA